MSKVTTKAIAKVAAVATGLAMATSMLSLAPIAHAASLSNAQVQSILSLLSSFGADSATIANVQAALTGQASTGGSGTSTGGSTSSCTFTRDLTNGVSGDDVSCLQRGLLGAGYSIPALSSGAASYGYFGSQTVAAVAAWQKAAGVSPAVGYFGAISRAHWNLGGGSTGGTGGVGAGTGTGLKVSLSATSPSGSVLVQGQGIGVLGSYTFANPTSAPINVTGLTFNRTGVSNDTTLTNVYLYQGGNRLTDSAGVSNSQFSFTNAAGIITIPAGGVVTIDVRSDISSTGATGSQIGVSLVSVSSTGTLDSSVSFPIMSGYQTVSSASLAAVQFTGSSATPSATTLSAQNDYPIWQNSVSVSTNPVTLSAMKFTNLGSVNASDVVNLRLYVDGTQVGSAVPSLAADRSVTFDLSANPVTLSTTSHVVKVLANVLSTGASRTIQLSVQRSADAMFIDSQLHQPVTPTHNGSTSFSAVSTGIITVQSASAGVSVSKSPASPTQNVAAGATNVKWASFDMLASGENVKVSDLYVVASSTKSTGALDGVGGLNNGKILVNGVQVGSTKDITQGNTSTAYGSATDFSLGSSLILPGGQTTTVDVYADAQDTAGTNLSNNSTVQVFLASASGASNGQGVSSLVSVNVPSSATSGSVITISSSSLTATKATGYGNQTVIAGANNAKLGSFTLSTGSTEGVMVNTINITFPNEVSSTITNLTLKDDSTGNTLGAVVATPSMSNSFAVNIDVPVSSTKTFSIYGNVLSGANTGTIVASVGTGTTGTGDTTNQSATVGTAATLQTISLGSGTLTVTNGAGDPVSDNVLAGASAVNVGEFTFNAVNSSYTVNNLAITIPSGNASAVTNVTVSYKDQNGTTQTRSAALTTSTTKPNATATFTGLGMYVPTNDSASIDVSVGTPSIASVNKSGTGINVTLVAHGSGVFLAQDGSGSATTSMSSGSQSVASNGTHYVRKSIPTFAVTSTLNNSAISNPLYAFTVTADPAGAIEWTKLKFTVATSTATLTNVYLTDVNGTNLLDNTTSSASTTATAITVDLTKNSTQPKYQQVAAGATKTYYLYGTVTGYGASGDSVSIALNQDTGSPAANAAAGSVSGTNVVWSDRSASSHSITSSDWTSGSYLKNFTQTTVSYSK